MEKIKNSTETMFIKRALKKKVDQINKILKNENDSNTNIDMLLTSTNLYLDRIVEIAFNEGLKHKK